MAKINSHFSPNCLIIMAQKNQWDGHQNHDLWIYKMVDTKCANAVFCWPLPPCLYWLINLMLAGYSVLPFALAGSLGGCDCWDGSLVEGSRYFVDVVEGQDGENKTGRDKNVWQWRILKRYYKSGDFFQKYCALSACDTYHVVTHTRCTSPEANSDKHRHNRTEW